jgi:hypothetical protein
MIGIPAEARHNPVRASAGTPLQSRTPRMTQVSEERRYGSATHEYLHRHESVLTVGAPQE